MIFGIGIDVLEAQRMRDSYARFGARLLDRLLLPQERRQFDLTRSPERFLAMRFAAKEAIVKAMGTGFAHGIWIRDVGVVQNARGKPEVIYSPRGERMRRRLGVGEGHITLTDEAGLIIAVAVLLRDGQGGRRRIVSARARAEGSAGARRLGKRSAPKRGPRQ